MRPSATHGIVITDFGHSDYATSIALQPDGKIVLAGQGTPSIGQVKFALACCRPNRTLDPTFGVNGLVTPFIGDGYFATAVGPAAGWQDCSGG